MVVDYNSVSPGDSPASFVEYDANSILVLVENASGKRIDLVRKDGSALSTYLLNSSALTGIMRKLLRLPDGSLLVSKSTAIEKFSPTKARVTVASMPYVNSPGGSCANSASLITGLATWPDGKILFTHAASSPNNKIGVISASGYSSTADCVATQAPPTSLALPTSPLMHSSGKLLVAYASTTPSANTIHAYDVNASINSISNATVAYTDPVIVFGPTAIAEDTATGAVFVANGGSSFNSIEKFSFNSSTRLLTRTSSTPFIGPQVYTRCVTDMKVMDE